MPALVYYVYIFSKYYKPHSHSLIIGKTSDSNALQTKKKSCSFTWRFWLSSPRQHISARGFIWVFSRCSILRTLRPYSCTFFWHVAQSLCSHSLKRILKNTRISQAESTHKWHLCILHVFFPWLVYPPKMQEIKPMCNWGIYDDYFATCKHTVRVVSHSVIWKNATAVFNVFVFLFFKPKPVVNSKWMGNIKEGLILLLPPVAATSWFGAKKLQQKLLWHFSRKCCVWKLPEENMTGGKKQTLLNIHRTFGHNLQFIHRIWSI